MWVRRDFSEDAACVSAAAESMRAATGWPTRARRAHTPGSPTGTNKTLAASCEAARVGKSKLLATRLLEFYLYFNAAGQIELHQFVHRFLSRAD